MVLRVHLYITIYNTVQHLTHTTQLQHIHTWMKVCVHSKRTQDILLSQASDRQCPERLPKEVLLRVHACLQYLLEPQAVSMFHAHGTPLPDVPVCLICGCHWLQVKYDLLIGADGVGSTVRSEMEHQLPGMSGAPPLLHLCLCFSLPLQRTCNSSC